jgi:hypothetical protein
MAAAGGCDAPDTRNCPLVASNGSDQYLLDYELLIPSNCPVPLGSVGEWKRAGANVFDYGVRDFRYAQVYVQNSDGAFMNQELDFFRDFGEYSLAQPSTVYPAGTGGTGFDLSKRYDFGWFFATNNPAGGTTADPYGQIRITYVQSAMANVIEGNAIPPRNSTATWRAAATGGTSPYNYYWYRDGALVGTSEYYTGATGTENFGLRAVVVDQTMTERTAVFPVDVGGALVYVDGPDVAYLYTYDPFISNATWTAVVTGGTAPFTYRWYRDGYPTGGNTASHTEHIDERVDFRMRVVVQDATGKIAVDDKLVRVAEIPCSTCSPQ